MKNDEINARPARFVIQNPSNRVSSYRRDEPVRIERLFHILDCLALAATGIGLIEGGQHHDGHVGGSGVAFKEAADLEAVNVGKLQIEQYQSGTFLSGLAKSGCSVEGRPISQAGKLRVSANDGVQIGVVLHDQYVFLRIHLAPPRCENPSALLAMAASGGRPFARNLLCPIRCTSGARPSSASSRATDRLSTARRSAAGRILRAPLWRIQAN